MSLIPHLLELNKKEALRLNLKSSLKENKYLLLEEDEATRQGYLANLIATNNRIHPLGETLFKVITLTEPSDALKESILSLGGKIIEAKSFATNFFEQSPLNKENELKKTDEASEFMSLARKLQVEIFGNGYYPNKVYQKMLASSQLHTLSDSERSRLDSYPSLVKMSYFRKQIILNIFSQYFTAHSNLSLDNYLSSYLDNTASPSITGFMWFLMEAKVYEANTLIADLVSSLGDVFFSPTPTSTEGHALFVANHPDPVINSFLLVAFLQEAKGEFVSKETQNFLLINERYLESNDLFSEQLSRILTRASHQNLSVVIASSFIPSPDNELSRYKHYNELAYLLDGLILGRLTKDYQYLGVVPYPTCPSEEVLKEISERKVCVVFLKEGVALQRIATED